MRIALLTYSTRPRGGVVHTLALAEALATLGHDVTVWAIGRGGDSGFFRPVGAAVTVRVVPLPERQELPAPATERGEGLVDEGVGPRILRSIDVLARAFAVQRGSYDIVHAQDCITANAAPGSLRTVHHLDTFTTPELAACHERALQQPPALLCVSGAVAAELAAGWGRRATVIPNGVDAPRFARAGGDAPPAVRARAIWRSQLGEYALAVGGIEPRKGTLDLVEAMAIVARVRPGMRLVVAGGETLFDYRPYRAEVEARCAALGVEPAVLGPVDHEQLPALVAAATVFAFPSTKEGFGLAAMEALAAGAPVVARDLPVLREVFGSAVRYASDVPTLAEELLAAAAYDARDTGRRVLGERLAAAHTWERAARAHERFYRAVLDGAGEPVSPPGAG